jgi:hypothetical protein
MTEKTGLLTDVAARQVADTGASADDSGTTP